MHVLAAACLWGTTGTVRTFVPAASSFSIAAVRIVFGGLVLLTVTSMVDNGDGLRRLLAARSSRLLLGPAAVAMATYQTAFFCAAARTGVAIGTVVTIGSAPAFAGMLSVLVHQGRLAPRWLVATAGAVVGCTALIVGGHDAGAEPVGIGLALLSGLAYAVYATVLAALISGGEDDRAVTAALFAAAAVLVAPVVLAGSAGWVLTARGAPVALYLGGIATAGGYMLFARGLLTTPATTATTLTLAEPAVAAVLGVVVLHEHLGAVAIGGLAVLAASLVVLARGEAETRAQGRARARRTERGT